MPNPSQTGYINLTSKVEDYIIDFATFEDSIAKVSGTIMVADDFIVGEKYDLNGNWNGYSNIRVEAISKTTGEWIASTEVAKQKDTNGAYPFSIKIGDIASVGKDFIIKINKESSTSNDWKQQEVYINFGEDHDFNTEDSLVNGKKVQWKEAQELPSWGGNYKNWMPNPEQTGWIDLESANNNDVVNIDLSTLGANDIKLSGTVTFKNDFNLSLESNGARISIIDATTGNWIADESIENNGSYSVNVGETAGNYIVQINYWHNDYADWQNSWWRNKIVDFGDNNSYDTTDEVLNDSDVQWKSIKVEGQSWDMWIPDVYPISVTASLSGLDFDLSATSGGTISGTINGIPSGVQWPYVMIVNPQTYSNKWIELKEQNGTYSFNADELRVADYTVEFGYEKDGRYYNFFIKDDNNDTTDGVGTVDGSEVSWQDLGNNIWGPNPEDTTYITVTNGVTTNLNISLTATTYNSVRVTLTGTEDNKYVSADMNLPGKPFGRWEQNTTVGTNVSFTFDDVKDGSGYILNFWYDNASYTCDGAACESLKKNAMWIAYDSNNVQVCPTGTNNNDWNCNWDNSYNWTWKPDVTPLNIAGTDGVANITATLPEEKTVSGALSLGSDFAGSNVYVSVFQHMGSDYNWADFTLDSNGEVNSSIKVEGGSNYRIELWVDGLGGYVYTTSGWINQNNSWEENNTTHMWEPKATTLIDINENLDLGLVNIASNLSKVTVILENLDRDGSENIIEDVWVNFESQTNGYYGDGNANWENVPVTYDGNITLRVPDGTDYRITVFPSNHKGGYGSDGDDTNDETITAITNLGWNKKDYITIDGETSITVTLPSKATLGVISGTVTCGTDDCSGWIEAFNDTDGKGTEVDSNGSFTIKGLEAGSYEVNYKSNSGLNLSELNVMVTADSTTTLNISKIAENVVSISGNITGPNGVNAVLLKTDGTTWVPVLTKPLDENGNFDFGEFTKPIVSKTYYVAGGIVAQTANGFSVQYGGAVEAGNSGITLNLGDKASSEIITVNLN
jgi:hypothetical protein